MKERKNWIDWMKTICMFFIVWGHMFPERMTSFVYAFNVPVFFIISGLLDKTRGGASFCKKLWKGLILPYIIICLSYLLINSVFLYQSGDLSFYNYIRSIGYMAAGFQSCPHGIGAVAMWFVYTLLIIKIVFRVIKDWRWLGILSVLCVVGSIMCHGHSLYWSVQNALLALPFYYLGWIISNRYSSYFHILTESLKSKTQANTILTLLFVILGFTIVYIIGNNNGFVRVYMCDYGQNIDLFFTGSILGALLLYLISIRLDNIVFPCVKVISVGNIVILSYQFIPIKIYGGIMLIPSLAPYKNNDYLTLIVSFFIMWMFTYVIKYVERYAPIILGGRKIT